MPPADGADSASWTFSRLLSSGLCGGDTSDSNRGVTRGWCKRLGCGWKVCSSGETAPGADCARILTVPHDGLLSFPGGGDTVLAGRCSKGAEFGRSCPLNKSQSDQVFACDLSSSDCRSGVGEPMGVNDAGLDAPGERF
mmetsp:Transcript_15071/g.45537  ORF Transcript_15071/g.45537 Transcript_15071/m.45537 type:complete len:139 (+) Transcript_15071:1027-1443(+)